MAISRYPVYLLVNATGDIETTPTDRGLNRGYAFTDENTAKEFLSDTGQGESLVPAAANSPADLFRKLHDGRHRQLDRVQEVLWDATAEVGSHQTDDVDRLLASLEQEIRGSGGPQK